MSAPGRALTLHCSDEGVLRPEVRALATVDQVAPPAEGTAHLWFATLKGLHERTEEFNGLLDTEEQERAHRFHFRTDRDRYILGHGLLRTLLGRYLGQDATAVRMPRGRFGKPYVAGTDLRFSFSDTKDAILVAFTTGNEIGADIETMHRTVDHAGVSAHYFTPPEITAIEAAGTDAKRRFLEFWTRKEAVLKASGVGIMDDLRSLRVDDERNDLVIRHEAFMSMAAPAYHVHTWQVGSDHLISLASPVRVAQLSVWSPV